MMFDWNDDEDVGDRKVRMFVERLAEATRGEVNYNISRGEFAGQHSEAAIHPNCNADCRGEFRCARCRRLVGWCFGGADGITDGLCDDCTVAVWGKVGV